jgi:hypothetical protein
MKTVMQSVWLSIMATLVACSASETTTGKRVALRVVAESSPSTFTTVEGWTVTLSSAQVSVGPQYYYDGATIFSSRAPSFPSRLYDALIPSAYAHPGHYVAGNARGEMLVPTSLDLVTGGGLLGIGSGTTGIVRSGTFSFQSPAQGPLASALAANVLSVAGTAVKGSDTRKFFATLTASDVSDAGGKPEIEGCAFADTEVTESGTVTIRVAVAKWFDLVEFQLLPAGADGVAVALAGVARNEFVRGVRAGDRYTFAFRND